MFQLFSRAKTANQFRARNAARDAETDAARVGSIGSAIEAALLAAQAEHAGLSERLRDVVARAAITVGTETDEYIDRAPEDTALQNHFSTEIANGERRLRELATSMGHYRFLRTVLATRFPEHTAADVAK
ncbi:hypothetical protein [Rhodopseudomonas palustris]|uniref:hypothetical protein n=1 Tax=Rhodopseudomonas palustris TaxID=1076 RepID=UPI000E5BA75B|nr:hypothetical protein [Rhodopseudomonas palustris]QLH73486.1 hypothetical protein HZF03_22870 [Rhodopseudomonas palustris]RIA02894.1 hypothetical protein D1920_05395 [Rhodopseudomonas palustris]